MVLYDIHTHHIATRLAGQDVRQLVNIAPTEFIGVRDANSSLSFSCGIHPWHIQDYAKELLLLEELASSKPILAIGEVGLDRLRGLDFPLQKRLFEQQIAIAQHQQKPLIIHCVRAWDELIAIYKASKTDIPWIIHGYRGNPQQTKQLSKLGFRFSIGEHFHSESLQQIPLSSLFCETDMSELSIETIYQNVAKALSISISELASTIEDNSKKIFG